MSQESSGEYFSPATANLIAETLDSRPSLPMTWLETRIYPELYESLSGYMNRVDLLYMLSELRRSFLTGFTSTTPENLHKVCARCRLCEGVKSPAETPVWHIVDPDSTIVVANPTVRDQYKDFLISNLKSVGLKSDRIMLTYMTRCPIYSADIQDEHIVNCVPYLHSEMQACNPKAILVLGSKCWGAITGDTVHKISEIEKSLTWFGLYPMIPGMSLAWYARNSRGESDTRFADLLSVAYNFLYSETTDKQ